VAGDRREVARIVLRGLVIAAAVYALTALWVVLGVWWNR